MKVVIDYPTESEEIQIMQSFSKNDNTKINKILSKKELLELQELVEQNVFVDEKIFTYVKDLVFATRYPLQYNLSNIAGYISY